MRAVVDIIADVVAKMNTSLAASPVDNYTAVNYYYGHLAEIRQTFIQGTTNQSIKRDMFPAVILLQDFPEKTNRKEHRREVTVKILILTDTEQKFIASERYANTFTPILYPLEDLFFTKLESSNEVSGYDTDYTRTDRLKWGTLKGEEGTATWYFADFIDAIEIENLNIKIINTC